MFRATHVLKGSALTAELNPSYALRKTKWKTHSVWALVTVVIYSSQALGDERQKSQSRTISTKPDEDSRKLDNPESKVEAGLELAYLSPPSRPAVGLNYTHQFSAIRLSLRLQGSWVSLSKTFSEAAQKSSYANRLSEANAQLTEVNLSAPELALTLLQHYFIAVSPILRATHCSATYSTVNDNALQFESAGLSLGVQGAAGIRIGGKFKVEFATGFHLPINSIGAAAVNYTQTSSNSAADFNDQELDSILNSLQPYAKELSEGFTLQFGVRGLWKI
ncbi:MAG: hypothetical protein RJB13_2470 [Pseudomonadota bacterium]|jgi:hypothetical protein